ncbi:hypothetical protein HCN44_004282 [Aphidius gifuensis]|uniref:Non-homologous end-joining factor 1 n=1 Tax=Aphidius gifuensis TaxID=684658 RepID=A0A834XZB4_APHGI|nr:uncharacterized protein LOC122848555 [Aphidius gifuensis]KAF7994810.1 hypothetical protein HCN44_004282 [Aphidius gifuensis]
MKEIKWEEVVVNEENYLISCCKIDNTWKIMLTNLIELWTESLTREKITQDCESLNPLLIIEDISLDKIISELLDNIIKYAIKISTSVIALQNKLDDGIFKFQINLSKSSPNEFFQEITIPLCSSVGELMRKNKILIQQIKKKDEEIIEYRACGAELLRENIKTETFSDEILKPGLADWDVKSCAHIFKSAIPKNDISKLHNKIIKKKEETIKREDPVIQMELIKTEEKLINEKQKNKSMNTPKVASTVLDNKIHQPVINNSTLLVEKQLNLPSRIEKINLKKKNETSSSVTVPAKRQKKTLKDFIA